MEKRVLKELNHELQNVYTLTRYISLNKKNIMDFYIDLQYELYEVEEEVEEEFNQMLKKEASAFLSSLKKVETVLSRSMFHLQETDLGKAEFDNPKIFLKMASDLDEVVWEIGSVYVTSVEDDLYEFDYLVRQKMRDAGIPKERALEELDIDQIEQLSDLKEFLNELVDAAFELTADLEVMLESSDEDDEVA